MPTVWAAPSSALPVAFAPRSMPFAVALAPRWTPLAAAFTPRSTPLAAAFAPLSIAFPTLVATPDAVFAADCAESSRVPRQRPDCQSRSQRRYCGAEPRFVGIAGKRHHGIIARAPDHGHGGTVADRPEADPDALRTGVCNGLDSRHSFGPLSYIACPRNAGLPVLGFLPPASSRVKRGHTRRRGGSGPQSAAHPCRWRTAPLPAGRSPRNR